MKLLGYAWAMLAASTASAATTPGFGVSITETGANKAKNVVMPIIFSKLKDFHIDEIDFDGGNLKNIDIQIPQPELNSVAIKFDSSSNGAEVTCSKAEAKLTSDFHYKYLFISVDGKADININKAALDVLIDAGTQAGTPAYELAPKLTANKFDINVNPDDIDIQLTGGLVAKIANVLIPLLKNSVVPSIISQVTDTAKTLIDTTIDDDLKIYGNQQEIPYLSGVTADYAQIGGPQFTSGQFFQMGVNGTFFDADDIHKISDPKATFALRDANGKEAQAYLTEYTINSALDAGYLTGLDLDITYLLQTYLNLTVTTDVLGLIIPELVTKYGSGKAVGLSGKWMKAPATAAFLEGEMTASGSLQVTVTVDSEVAIKATFVDFAGAGGLHSQDGKIFGQITKSSAGTIDSTGFQTTLGLTAAQLQNELQTQIDTAITDLNLNLTAGVVIPTIMGIDVSDVEIKLMKGYGELGMSLSPTSWLQIAQIMGDWKQQLLAKRGLTPESEVVVEKHTAKKIDHTGEKAHKKSFSVGHFIGKAYHKLGEILGFHKKTHKFEKFLNKN